MSPAAVETFETTVGGSRAALVHAPTDGQGLPVVALVHGSHVHPRHYGQYAAALAAEGFVVVAPEEQREAMGTRAHFPQQAYVNWVLDWAVAENARADSPLAGRIDTDALLLTGHSMGGGTTLGIVADAEQFGLVVDPWSRPAQLRGALVLGTHNIPPPRTGDPLPVDNRVPLAFVQGTVDGVVTLDQSRRSFAAVHGVLPRLFVEVDGGTHFFVTDTALPEGANADPNAETLDHAVGVASTARWSALWFRGCLGDAEALARLRKGPDVDEPHVRTELVEG